MKKHIQKKFLNQIQITKETAEQLAAAPSIQNYKPPFNFKKVPKDMDAHLYTEDHKLFKAFWYKHKDGFKLIPEPDPVLVYFNAAYLNYRQLDTKKQEILSKLSNPTLSEVMINELYEYFSLASSCAILLFTALECLINRSIPKEYLYKRETSKSTEVFNKAQIEKYLSFEEKLDKVLKLATDKSFKISYPKKFQHITNLKEYRDMIVHTKESGEGLTYDYLYRKGLNFNYSETLDAVKDFCNYYKEHDFIIECPCDQDF